jgi:hypothetical protein
VATRRRPWLALAAGLVAVSALGGAIAFLAGWLDMGDTLTQRLPLESPVLAGTALGVWVAAPFALLAVAAWTGSPATDRLAMAAGSLLVAWLVVQLAFIRTLSFFHPLYGAIGAAFVWVGWRAARRRRDHRQPGPGPWTLPGRARPAG